MGKIPSDKEILDVGVRGLYIGNFFKWDPNYHAKLMNKNITGNHRFKHLKELLEKYPTWMIDMKMEFMI